MYDSTGLDSPVKFCWGLHQEQPTAPKMGRAGILWYSIPTSSSNASTFWLTDVESGVLTWKLIGGTGSALGGAMKYFVNNSPTSSPQPSCLYSTIAAAIAAAVADGHSASYPAVIWLCPSATYTESVTLPAGISLKGMADDYHVNHSLGSLVDTLPVITGTVELSAGSCSLSYVRVAGQVHFAASAGGSIVLDNVEIVASVGAIGLDIEDPNVTLYMHRVSVAGTETPGTTAMRCNVAATISGVDVDIWAASQAGVVFAATGGGTHSFRNSKFTGVFSISAGSLDLDNVDSISSGLAPFTLATAAALTIRGSRISNDYAVTVAGTGTYTFTDNEFPLGTQTIAATVTSVPVYLNRSYTETLCVFIVSSFNVTQLFDLYNIDTNASGSGGTDKTINLPQASTVPLGTRLSFQRIVSNGNDATIVRFGGDLINGVAANVVLGVGTYSGVTLQARVGGWSKVASVA